MFIRKPSDIVSSEITSEEIYRQRRQFLRVGGALLGAAALPVWFSDDAAQAATPAASFGPSLGTIGKSKYSTSETQNSYEQITTYNNFYEFGIDKSDPAANAQTLRTRPWTVTLEGLVQKPRTLGIEDILKLVPLEERIYRLRCVEGWSMVIPWVGFSLSALLKQVEPLGSAKYVEFVSQADPAQMPGVRSSVLDWPYSEGLRMDEAMHPLTLMAVGLYGRVLPNQNGAPIRLVVPWKYGFKSAKSIVRIRFVEREPRTAWVKAAPAEYGFYSNVNPAVDHPRWSQAKERRIGEFFKRATLPFNGYADQVAQLYSGMDLRRYF